MATQIGGMEVKPLFILTIIVLGVLLLVGVDETSASSLTTSLALFSLPSGAVLEVKLGCKLVDGQLICGKKNGNAGNDNGNNDQGSKKKKKNKETGGEGEKNKETGSEGEPSCGPGFVVLKEKNQYGNYCQPTEAVKPNCAPGTVLNGEQCNCPAGTVPKNGINSVQSVDECQVKRLKECFNITRASNNSFANSCTSSHPNAQASCSNPDPAGDPNELISCCCEFDSQ